MKNVDKITLYLRSGPGGQAGNMDVLKQALADSGADAQANARRWVVLGMLTERAGFRADNGILVHPSGGFIPSEGPASTVKPIQRASLPVSNRSAGGSPDQKTVSSPAVVSMPKPESIPSVNDHSVLFANLRTL